MMFLFKEKKIVVDCFTTDPFSYEYAGIASSLKYAPEWWKDLPVLKDPKRNMKTCLGFTNLYKKSYVIPMWGSLNINLSSLQERSWMPEFDYDLTDSRKEPFSMHPPHQFKGFVDESYIHVKMETPWILKTKSKTNFLFTDPIWNRNELVDYAVLPGIVDYKYSPTTAINIMFKLHDQPRTVSFKPSDPMAMIVPLTDDVIEFKNHLVDYKELQRQFPQIRLSSDTRKLYSVFKNFITKHDERQESKCPFGFKK